jgi:hypothetical protein
MENAKAAAEIKKKGVIAEVQKIRAAFVELLKENILEDDDEEGKNAGAKKASDNNGEFDSESYIHKKKIIPELVADPEYIKIVKEEQAEKIEEVHRELAWGIEYHELGIKKLQERF